MRAVHQPLCDSVEIVHANRLELTLPLPPRVDAFHLCLPCRSATRTYGSEGRLRPHGQNGDCGYWRAGVNASPKISRHSLVPSSRLGASDPVVLLSA